MTSATSYRVADLSQTTPTSFDIRLTAPQAQALAASLALDGLRKVRLQGQIEARARRDWTLTAHLGATVIQPCVVTLDPVITRIETDMTRHYLAHYADPTEEEAEMPEDETAEPVPVEIDLIDVLGETLALALPEYPRKDGAHLDQAIYSAPGVEPMRDEDTRPFAGLVELRDALEKPEDKD